MSMEEMTQFMGVDSLAFLTVEEMQACIAINETGERATTCTACFTGNYLTRLYEDMINFQEKC